MSAEMIGIVATVGSLLSYVPYFHSIQKGKTKPHAFTWFVWGVLNAAVFFVQRSEGAGPGAYITAGIALANLCIAFIALRSGPRIFPPADWFALVAAFVAMVVWVFAQQPILAIVLLALTDVIGFLPTWRKGWAKPHEEMAWAWLASGLSMALSLAALSSFEFTTALYPGVVAVLDTSFAVLIIVRSRSLKPN